MRLTSLISCLCLAAGVLAAPLAQGAAPWPQAKPIHWIVGFAPGGSVDVISRAFAQQVGAALGQSVVVENRPGGSGAIGLSTAARAETDGYTLVTMAGPILYTGEVPQLGKELAGVATLAEGAVVLVGTAGGPQDFAALADAIRKEPSRFAFASSGIATNQHIAGEMLNLALDADMLHVPYKGGGQAVTDIVGGQVQLGMLGVSSVLEQVRAGKLIAYAVTSPTRAEALPETPTLQEVGIPGFEATQWYVAAVPAGTPNEVRQGLQAAIQKALESGEIRQLLALNGMSLPSASAQDSEALVARALDQAWQVARDAKIDLQ
ncbi:MAG: Bug family tripartite tricarboxylate transporter substrate binding protein [Pigmentiphaga sp.]